MLNGIWIFMVVVSLIAAAFSGHVNDVTLASVEWAKKAVTIALGLIGIMAFWLGMMRVARDAGILNGLARSLRPIMTRLFPGVPAEHPAMSAMIMNISANMLGLANAATPFGIKAMEELDRLNAEKGTATNAMVLFLAINTSNVSLLPLGVMGVRASVGSQDVAGIVLTTLLATTFSTAVGITAATLISRLPAFRANAPASTTSTTSAGSGIEYVDDETRQTQAEAEAVRMGRSAWKKRLVWGTVIAVFATLAMGLTRHVLDPSLIQETAAEEAVSPAPAGAAEVAAAAADATRAVAEAGFLDVLGDITSAWILPLLIVVIALLGWARGVRVYESLVAGAREGFDVAIRIIPYLVAILVAVGMFQASGALDLLISAVSPVTSKLGLPGEALPMALLRPLSGSGAFGVMAHAMETYGPDSYVGYLVSTLQGSTETTFYVLAVYFGSVSVKKTRHALPACLIADAAGIIGAVLAVNLLLGPF